MRAIVLEKFGGLDSLVYKDIPEPEPKAGHASLGHCRADHPERLDRDWTIGKPDRR
jgi:hypothetical protein